MFFVSLSVVAVQVREVELSMDMASILRLLDFLEALFNGGSDFNEPLKRCLNRLTDAKWANSDILLVSGACVWFQAADSGGSGSACLPCCRVCGSEGQLAADRGVQGFSPQFLMACWR